MARRRKGRPVHGIIVLDKPTGRSSNHALQAVKRLFGAQKAGHTGSLDPLATGVLPICLGEATKLSTYLLDADKSYQVTAKLGKMTDTGDSEGRFISEHDIPELAPAYVVEIIRGFIGTQQQVPPMYSALKHQGQPLYKFARQGIDVERKAREITIYDIKLDGLTEDSFTLTVRCSKGTYIRTLVEEIAHALGSGGYVTMLRRITVAGYDLSQSITLTALEELLESGGMTALEAQLKPMMAALPTWPIIMLTEAETTAMQLGQRPTLGDTCPPENTAVRLLDPVENFIGLGEILADNVVASKRMFVMA